MTSSDPSAGTSVSGSEQHGLARPPADFTIVRSVFARQLLLVAVALFVLFGSGMVNPLLPPAIINPAWQIRLVASLVSSGYLPLIGLALIQHSYLQDPQRNIKNWRVKLSRIALLASLGFILAVPLQCWATWRLIREDFQSLDQGKPAIDQPLQQMEAAIKQAPDAKTLQTSLTILRGPAIAPQDMERPLPELKQILLNSLQEARRKLLAQAGKTGPDPRIWTLLQDTIRLSLASLVLAVAYSAFAQRRGVPMTVFEELTHWWKRRARKVDVKKKRSSGSRR